MAHSHLDHDAPPATTATRRLLGLLLAPFLVAGVIGMVVLWPSAEPHGIDPALGAPDDLVRARVVAVDRGPCAGTDPALGIICAVPTVEVLEGPDEGRRVVLQERSETGVETRLEPGMGVVLGMSLGAPEDFRYYFADLERRQPLLVLFVLFSGAVIVLARWMGLRALVGTGLSLVALAVFVLPAILDGRSPVAVALVGAAVIAVVTLYFAHGLNVRTTTALLGTFGSLALTGALAAVFVGATRLTGLAAEEAAILQISAAQVSLSGLLLAGIIVGTLGVLDDVTVTQVSAVSELRRANPSYGFAELYRAGVSIGQHHIAATVNTLVLAYAGASLPLLLLFTQADQGFLDVVNSEVVAVEVVRTLVGSIGLVASVPITTALAALVLSREPVTGPSSRTRPAPEPTAAAPRRPRRPPPRPAG